MTLKEANKKLLQLTNDLDYYTKQRDLNLQKVEPGSVDYSKDVVQGGEKQDRFANYLVSLEKKKRLTILELDEKIKHTKQEIECLNDWINRELEILKQYRDVEQQVIFYKESEKNYTWEQIAYKTGYSARQCQRIYNKYIGGKNEKK